MQIRKAEASDWDAIWPFFESIVKAGDTYAYDPDTGYEQGRDIWLSSPRLTFVAEEEGEILGSYYIKTNQAGPGSHVCNCGYMVAAQARGRGLATRLCEHSQQIAIELGYRAMQFNFVATSNKSAVRLWDKLGFESVGRLPKAFQLPDGHFVDALVMYKWLGP